LKKYFLDGADFCAKVGKVLGDKVIDITTIIQVQQCLNLITGMLAPFVN